MYNSTIKNKTGICIDCTDGEYKYLIAKRCSWHYRNHRQQLSLEKNKMRGLLMNPNNDLRAAELASWYIAKEKDVAANPFCQECKEPISKKYCRAAVAHCLPKRKEYGFPSLATNPINKLILGAGCGCHSRYDRSWEDAAKMKVWPLAVEIFKQLYHLIPANEKKNIPDLLLQEIEPITTKNKII